MLVGSTYLDVFAGVIGGDFPFHNDVLYGADVHDLKIQASVNLTFGFHLEILKTFKIDLEFDFEPILLTAGLDLYNTVWLGDNCFWVYYAANTLSYNTRFNHQMADCGYNMKDVLSGHSLSEFSSLFTSHPFYEDLACKYDSLQGRNTAKLSMLSGNFGPEWLNIERTETSKCLGSLDWAWLLIPNEGTHVDQEALFEAMR